MKAEKLVRITGADFFTGVPDSQLKGLCDYLIDTYGIDPKHHIIAANEGNCTAVAAGYHLSTGKTPVVYLQNSGEGNIINPVASLLNDKVYAIPMIFIIGWRGEPGVHDEPQHIFQGEVTVKLLDTMEISSFVIGKDTTDDQVEEAMDAFRALLQQGKSVAFVIRKGALLYEKKDPYSNRFDMKREEIIKKVISFSGSDPVISTTGKASRELFEAREEKQMGHQYDFLTVGSMGHCSSIALGVALQKPQQKIWCIDGDGAALMHLGAMAVIGANHPDNLVHIVINNEAHETVGGMPTVASNCDLPAIAKACGYPYSVSVSNYSELENALQYAVSNRQLIFIEAKCAIGARQDLGRPTTTAIQNKQNFMNYLKALPQ